MKGFRGRFLVRGGLALLACAVADAHFALVQPPSATAIEDGGKGAPPCGEGPPSNIVTNVQGGHPLAIRLSEFVYHPGHYRFALSVNSRAELPPDPSVVEQDGLSVSAAIQNPVRIPVIADGALAHTAPPAGDWQLSLTMPNLSCDRCTLQIVEFMAEHGPNIGGGFFYHHCADLKIAADPALPPADAAWPRSIVQMRAAFAHVAAGGGWATELNLINRSAAPVPVVVTFRQDDGAAVNLPSAIVQDGLTQISRTASVNAIVKPNATLLISTGDLLDSTFVGWADVQSSGVLVGYAIFRSTPAAGAPSEGTSPLQTEPSSKLTLPYDNTGGFVMGFALANLAASSADVSATVWDESGNRLETKVFTISGSGHTAFPLPGQLPSTAGKRGIVQFQSADAITGLALRFSPFGTFTSVPAI